MSQTKKGFTLIELLIVITIIGILAVAFLPTLLNAPAKGRDTARISAVEKISTVLGTASVDNIAYPSGEGCIANAAAVGSVDFSTLLSYFGGTVPLDPKKASITYAAGKVCAGGEYYYSRAAAVTGAGYSFMVMAKVEDTAKANGTCAGAIAGSLVAASADCYVVFVK